MNQHMNKRVRNWLILATLIVVALLAAFWATAFVFPPSLHELLKARPYPPTPPALPARGDIELYYTINTVISSINVTLLIFLLVTYIGIYRRIKSEFTIGLIIFSMVLLFYALASNPFVHWAFGFRAFGLGPFAMLPNLFTCVALAVLLYLTIKY